MKTETQGTVIEGIKFYKVPEVAKILRITPQTVRSYMKQGRLRGHRIGRPIFITEASLLEFLNTPVDMPAQGEATGR